MSAPSLHIKTVISGSTPFRSRVSEVKEEGKAPQLTISITSRILTLCVCVSRSVSAPVWHAGVREEEVTVLACQDAKCVAFREVKEREQDEKRKKCCAEASR